MNAIIYRSYGGPEKLELAERPEPKPGPGQLLIRVQCSSVNPIDWKRASGMMRLISPIPMPGTPGYDIAGEVVAIGAGVGGFSVGARVHARIGEKTGGGYAELALAGIDVTTAMPDGMDFAEAAGLPLAGMTALQGLRDYCQLPLTGAQQRVLIIGASGGVGHLALQIAKASGAQVLGVCSSRNADRVRGLGADAVIEYDKPDPYRGQEHFDIIYNCISGETGPWLPRLTKAGHYASCIPNGQTILNNITNPLSRKKVHAVMLKPRASDLAILDRLYAEKKLRVLIDSRFPLGDARKAWERSQGGRAVGKIIIDVASTASQPSPQ